MKKTKKMKLSRETIANLSIVYGGSDNTDGSGIANTVAWATLAYPIGCIAATVMTVFEGCIANSQTMTYI